MVRQHNNANMLSIGARVAGEGPALDILDAFMTAEFEGGRHATRVDRFRPVLVRLRSDRNLSKESTLRKRNGDETESPCFA